jgi:hypothetical protein
MTREGLLVAILSALQFLIAEQGKAGYFRGLLESRLPGGWRLDQVLVLFAMLGVAAGLGFRLTDLLSLLTGLQ